MNIKNKSVDIMSLEAKDIYNANNLINKNEVGYNCKDKNGNIFIKKFVNTLDYSLDLIKMREIYEKTYRRNDFTFNVNNHDYTQSVICIKFTYAHKEYNKSGKDTYVKAGYSYEDLEFKDCVCIKNGVLIGIMVNKKVKKPVELKYLPSYFKFEEGVYRAEVIPTLCSKSELRENLYENGFYCDGVKYIRFKRSAGSSRVGKCLFIDEKLYSSFNKWDLCGLSLKYRDEIDLAAFEAYISLPSSSIIDTIQIEPKNFLVIDDYDSVFSDNVVGIGYDAGRMTAEEGDFEVRNSIFDGESIADSSLFGEKYRDKGMLLLRNRFFKSACFNGNIQQWFKDNDITSVSQLNGFTLAKNIEDIKIITTPSSVKYVNFAPLEQWFKNLDTTFGIVKYEKPSHYFNGRLVQCHYQLLNTLHLSKSDVESLLKPNLDYISLIRNDPDVLMYHIKYPYNTTDTVSPLHSKNEIIFKLLGINSNFSKTKLYYDFRNDLVKALIKNLKQGHLLINGNYSILLGNGVEMLQHSIGKFNGKSVIGKGNIFCKRFEFGKQLLGSRSPHINSGNILLAQNVYNELIDKYFNLTNEIVYINAIEENVQQRLNGCDYDADSLLLTDNETLILAAQKNYNTYKVPTCLVRAKKVRRVYTSKDKADLDIKTSVNKIGEIVNLSQYLNSLMWDNLNKGQTVADNQELYFDICKLAVLSGIEIDRAKREYELNSGKVIKELKQKWAVYKNNKLVKPMFFKMITQNNGYQLNDNHDYKYFNTSMDYLQKQIGSFNFRCRRKAKETFLSFSGIVKKPSGSFGGQQYSQKNRILSLIKDLKDEVSRLYIDYQSKTQDEKNIVHKQACELRQQCVDYINDISINDTVMYLLLKAIESKEHLNVSRLILGTLFGTPNEMFFTMIKTKTKNEKLIEDENGDIKMFDFKFSKSGFEV